MAIRDAVQAYPIDNIASGAVAFLISVTFSVGEGGLVDGLVHGDDDAEAVVPDVGWGRELITAKIAGGAIGGLGEQDVVVIASAEKTSADAAVDG